MPASDQWRRADHPEGRRRMPGADHWPRVPVFWGLHLEGRRPRVPHIGTAHDSRTRPTGARRANVPQNRLKRTKNVKKPDFTAVFTPFLKIGDNLQNPYKKPVIFVKIYYYAMKWAFFDVYMLKNIVFKHICRGF